MIELLEKNKNYYKKEEKKDSDTLRKTKDYASKEIKSQDIAWYGVNKIYSHSKP